MENAVRLYKRLRDDDEVFSFLAPALIEWDPEKAVAFLRRWADSLEANAKEKYPNGLPF